MAATKRKKMETPVEEIEEMPASPVQEAPVENAETPVETAPVEEAPAEETPVEKAPLTERLREVLTRADEGCPPALVQFEQRSGRPCTVLVESGERAVREAWRMWSEECGRNQEEFVMAVLDAMDAWPARIMRPCTFVRLD